MNNEYVKISVGCGRFALIDESDLDMVKRCGGWSSYYEPTSKTYYVKCFTVKSEFYNSRLHRIIMELKKGDKREVDHINHNGLDNRRCNLRIVNKSQQNMNVRPIGSIVYKGVAKSGKYNQYVVRIQKNFKSINCGIFYTKTMAAIVYDHYAKKMFGCHAYLNFPNVHINIIKQIIRNERIIRQLKKRTNKYIGVSRSRGKYQVCVSFDRHGKKIHKYLGRHDDQIEAAKCYDEYIKRHCIGKELNFG